MNPAKRVSRMECTSPKARRIFQPHVKVIHRLPASESKVVSSPYSSIIEGRYLACSRQSLFRNVTARMSLASHYCGTTRDIRIGNEGKAALEPRCCAIPSCGTADGGGTAGRNRPFVIYGLHSDIVPSTTAWAGSGRLNVMMQGLA